MSGDASALIEVGSVGAPFGVRGWVKLNSHTDPPERLIERPRHFHAARLGRRGMMLTAVGTIVKPGSRVAFSEGRVSDASGAVVATATSTCLVFDVPQ